MVALAVVLVQPLVARVNVKEAVPAVIPVTTPEFVTVAIEELLLVQVPPVVGDNVVMEPGHMIFAPVKFTGGLALTLTVRTATEVHPMASVTTTVYVVVVVGLTVMEFEVDALFHK